MPPAVNPRLRKIRDGLNELGLPTQELLNHGAPRLIYAMSLIENLTDYLLGRARRAKYIMPQKPAGEGTERIIKWWLDRWVRSRVKRGDVLERIAAETLIRPVRHAARVRLPHRGAEQRQLFE